MAEDLTNLQFGKLTVIKRGDNDKSGHVRWWCKCDCGNPKLILVAAGHLKSGHTQSCGCIRRDNIKPQKNLEGKRFGKLIVKEFLGIKNHRSLWSCDCDCGKKINALSSSLTSGKLKSCGCLSSVAEFELSQFLTDEQIIFDTQYKFDDCKYKRRLPFDFAIFHPQNKKLLFLIELHGEQHYFPFTFNSESDMQKKENFLHRKHLDKLKEDYCSENNIPLLIIRYTNFQTKEKIVKGFYEKLLQKNITFDDYIFSSKQIKDDLQVKHKRVYKRKVVQIDIPNKNIIREYNSMEEAYKITGISSGQISDCCKGNCKTAGGYAWAYNNGNVNIEEVIKRATIPNRTNAVVIFQKDKNGNIIKEWQSITEAAHFLGVSHQGIQACCSGKQKTCKGFVWNYKQD